MKAYKVYCIFCEFSVFVFAESENKAKSFAYKNTNFHTYTTCEYTDLRVNRLPKLDCEYNPKENEKEYELDWCNLEDRKIIAKHGYCFGQDEFEEDTEVLYEMWEEWCKHCEIRNECEEY